MRKIIRGFFMAIMVIIWSYTPAPALINEESASQFQFNFITPGARATAMGGAFIGLADDATAVEANPAGLTNLLEPEFSAELKYFKYTTNQIYENRSFATDITRKDFENFTEGLSFASLVFPCAWFNKTVVLSLYRQELVNYESSFRTGGNSIYVPGETCAFEPIDAAIDMTVTNYGMGLSIELVKDKLSLAISPRWANLKIQSHSARFKFGTDFSDEQIKYETRIDDEDSGFSVNVGALWTPHPKLSFGAVYKSGAKFKLTETYQGTGFWYSERNDAEGYVNFFDQVTLKVPDSFGIGVAFRATDLLTFTLDVVHIQYEDLIENFQIFSPSRLELTEDTEKQYTVDNATEIHLGMEYIVLFNNRALALRAGVYNDPDHTIRYSREFPAAEELFPGGDDQIHVTGGLGFMFSDHFQIDAAANIAENLTQFSISTVYRF